jgi:hypothetical protein
MGGTLITVLSDFIAAADALDDQDVLIVKAH